MLVPATLQCALLSLQGVCTVMAELGTHKNEAFAYFLTQFIQPEGNVSENLVFSAGQASWSDSHSTHHACLNGNQAESFQLHTYM